MLQPLAHQHDLHAGIDQRLKLTRTIAFQLGLQLVLEVFFAQQIESVAADPPQNGVHNTSRKYPVRAIKKRTHHCHREHQPATHPAFSKCLRIPSEERHWPDGRQVQQTAFHTPINRRSRAQVLLRLFQVFIVRKSRGQPNALPG